jgi:2-polyprenyl-3-methyl-5-hydroxy-6-metoxy-1,4-benzoquinol methylase
MSLHRVALIYDDRQRPETTGGYCLRALRGLAEAHHFLPDELPRVPGGAYDLYLNIDDGLRYTLPAELRPTAWWAIDTHLDFAWCLEKAHGFDFVFAAQHDGAFGLRDEGISTAWLPLACDPEIHARHELAKTWDVCFVGSLFPGPRADLVDLLRRRFPTMFVGQRYFEEMARTYSASRIVFNRSIANDINMRVFEALSCGSLLMTNGLADNGQAELFRDGIHLATYKDAEELVDKVAFYLAREGLRERIAAAGRAEALAGHTYRHRMTRLLEEVEKGLGACQVAVISGLPGQSAPAEDVDIRLVPDEPDPPGAGGAREEAYDWGYFEFARPELLALISEAARKVLDIGCGAGRLGEALKARQPAQVTGIERVEAAGQAARGRLDHVLVGDVEEMELPFEQGSFDAVVCGDVLEHLRGPERLLRRVRDWLGPEGCLVASIPNVRHHSVVRTLLEGNWTYEPAGLLDRTHLRFFTRRDIERMLAETGFTVSRLAAVEAPGEEGWRAQCRPGEVRVGRLHVGGMPPEEAEEFYTYQFLLTAVPTPDCPPVSAKTTPATLTEESPARPPGPVMGERALRMMYLGDFGSSWRHEAQAANALEELGHSVRRFHEYLMPSVDHVVNELNSGRYDCLLFYKGRVAARSPSEAFEPNGEAIAEVIRRAKVPCYTWYVDRALGFDFQPSREAWMRRVAPLCRVAFVADGPLTQTPWASWHVLREPIDSALVQKLCIPDAERQDVAFIGQLYGDRERELAPVAAAFPLHFISGVYGSDLSPVIQSYKIILGPLYPTVPGFWGNRVYVVLGHGGFFLAPEVPGKREEGILPGVHYAPLGADPVADIRAWLARPAERQRIARAGQELVLSRFTYAQAVRELCRVIRETL